MRKIDITGQKFGRLMVLSDTGKKSRGHRIWLCRCVCGQLIEVLSDRLRSSHTKSCGCLRKEIKHGDSCGEKKSRLYRIWTDMKSRCLNPKHQSYKYYGGKGIKICDEWKNNYLAFKSWALSFGYRQNLSIDRINSDGNYCPENCRWLAMSENVRNGNFKRWGERKHNAEQEVRISALALEPAGKNKRRLK